MPQSLSKISLHIVFSTKYRFGFFTDRDIRNDVHSYIAAIFNKRGATAIKVGGVADHIHILCLQSREELISKTIGEAKRSSNLWLKEKYDIFSNFRWQKGYGVFSVSESHINRVTKYIENQEEHHYKTSFKKEYRTLLKKYKIEYDEKYVWD
ncbi:MAG: IS200/IS605 family transposase [Candidatus Cloacimonetes bacterium]|nr:IS200/IS605 family transposase [Candidatus Cloacimonadota bacterium]